MTTTKTYALMSAAAYDERRGSNDNNHTKTIENFLTDVSSAGWERHQPLQTEGWDNTGGSSYSNSASGMQADVWENDAGEIVIAFRGTEASRAAADGDFRESDGDLDAATLADWSFLNDRVDDLVIPGEDSSIDLHHQATAALSLVASIIADNSGFSISLTGHSLARALSATPTTIILMQHQWVRMSRGVVLYVARMVVSGWCQLCVLRKLHT